MPFREDLIQAITLAVTNAVDDVLGTGKPLDRAAAAKAVIAAAAPALAGRKPRSLKRNGATRKPRRAGEISKWVPDKKARRVPTFVIEATGMKTKAAILKKWSEDSVFEKGKPLPKTKG